jgi:excinuclease UvrABC ATPase subunit
MKEWTVIEDCENNDFQPFISNILDNKLSINIDGLAGTGKSTLVNQVQEEMRNRNINQVNKIECKHESSSIEIDDEHDMISFQGRYQSTEKVG